jgi:predicted SprT family Zn-dependent metalloprotease
MKAIRASMAATVLLLAATSCSPHRVASWSVRTDEVRTYDEDRQQGQLQELLSLEGERFREEAVARRAKAHLSRRATCPRCYQPVYLSDTAQNGDEVRCGSCGKAFVLE